MNSNETEMRCESRHRLVHVLLVTLLLGSGLSSVLQAATPLQATLFHWVPAADGPTELREISGIENLSIDAEVVSGTRNGGSFRLNREQVWRIEWPQMALNDPAPKLNRLLQLGRGDRWAFESIAFRDDAFQVVHRAGFSPVSISLEHVPTLFWTRPRYGTPFPATTVDVPTSADRLLLENGDQLQGTLAALDDTGLTIQADFGDLKLPLSQLHELQLNPLLLSPAEPPKAAVVVALHDHTVLTALDIAFVDESRSLRATLADGVTMTWPLGQVRSLLFVSPEARPLTWLPVVESKQESYFGRTTPILQGGAATGTPLIVQGKTYPMGLGVRSGSSVTVQLPDGADEFWCVVGLDAAAKGAGIATVQVSGKTSSGEDRVLHSETLLSIENSPLVLGPLPLQGLHSLTLQTNYGPRADILDVIDWCLPTVRVARSQ